MRSADSPLLKLLPWAAAALLFAGCASSPKAPAPQPPSEVPAAAARKPVAAASADMPVDAATQRAFDDARRALVAGQRDVAERGFKTLAEAHPELGGVHANLGLIHARAGRTADAVASLERAVQASPDKAPYWNQLGIACRENGQFDRAQQAYERAIAIDGLYAAPVLNLAILTDLYRGDSAGATALYERYLVAFKGQDASRDGQVTKWIADLKNRRPRADTVAKKESS